MSPNNTKRVEDLEKLVEQYQREKEKLLAQLARYKWIAVGLIIAGLILVASVYQYQEYRWNQKLQSIIIQLKEKQ